MAALPSYSEVAAIEDFRDLRYVIPDLSLFLDTLTEDVGIVLSKYELDEVAILNYDENVTCYTMVFYSELPLNKGSGIQYLEYTLDVQFDLEGNVVHYDLDPSITNA